jgi:hypothetical protein
MLVVSVSKPLIKALTAMISQGMTKIINKKISTVEFVKKLGKIVFLSLKH